MSGRDVCTAGSTSRKFHGRNKVAVRQPKGGETLGSDAEESISILIALARPCADKYWHQRLPWFVNRVREKPLEVAPRASLLRRRFRLPDFEGVATSPGAIALFAEPASLVRDETNAAVHSGFEHFMTRSLCDVWRCPCHPGALRSAIEEAERAG